MDKREQYDLTGWLLEHKESTEAQEDALLVRRLGLVIQGIEARWGPVERLEMAGALVSFVAEPLQADAWRSGDQRARLRGVRVDGLGGGGTGLQPPTELMSACWRLLCDLTDAWRHGAATHAGFVMDFLCGTLSCWHAWTCQDCGTLDPCFTVRFGVAEPPENADELDWGDPGAQTAAHMLVAGVPVPCAVYAMDDGRHHRVA